MGSDLIEADQRVEFTSPRTAADRAFRALLFGCASTVLVIVAGIVFYLLLRVGPAWRHSGFSVFTTDWKPPGKFGFRGDLIGSVIIAATALIIAFPVSIATALAINEYLPRGARRGLTALIDLLAALPSLVFGLWGKYFIDPHLYRTAIWLGHHTTFFPFFRLDGVNQPSGSLFLAGLVVAIMVLPIMTAITREVMSQVPREDCEAALALGGTRWGMITTVILPFSRSGIVGGAMLGLGRALGETIAVTLVLAADDSVTSHILEPRGGSISELIAINYPAVTNQVQRSALTIAGLTLFALTLGVNIVARIIVARSGRSR